ncbi:hypothetical protein GCM10023215_34280 [Pseudonocardia yuanmonensis]|uniref:Amidase domain-containing protein n=1 Tax=Pseudonocardia yuanmonensis TaxID=1095914 RepID=A0ABP8WU51_9PSEU
MLDEAGVNYTPGAGGRRCGPAHRSVDLYSGRAESTPERTGEAHGEALQQRRGGGHQDGRQDLAHHVHPSDEEDRASPVAMTAGRPLIGLPVTVG